MGIRNLGRCSGNKTAHLPHNPSWGFVTRRDADSAAIVAIS